MVKFFLRRWNFSLRRWNFSLRRWNLFHRLNFHPKIWFLYRSCDFSRRWNFSLCKIFFTGEIYFTGEISNFTGFDFKCPNLLKNQFSFAHNGYRRDPLDGALVFALILFNFTHLLRSYAYKRPSVRATGVGYGGRLSFNFPLVNSHWQDSNGVPND